MNGVGAVNVARKLTYLTVETGCSTGDRNTAAFNAINDTERASCYSLAVKVGTQPKFTVWTAPASTSAVAALVQLDMRAPITGAKLAKKRAANAKQRSQRVLKHFASTSSAESLRNDGRRQETQEGRCEVSEIRTWKQYDKLHGTEGCEAEWEERHHGTRMCGTECPTCDRVEYCEVCNELIYALEVFERKQLTKARAQSKRKKAGSK